MMNFEKIFEQVYTENRDFILLGVFNSNLFEISCGVRTWLQVTESMDLIQLVDTPTCVTIIDHAYSNKLENLLDMFVPVFTTLFI